MFKKVLVLAILTVLVLSQQNDDNDGSTKNSYDYKGKHFGEKMNEDVQIFIILLWLIVVGIIVVINIYLCMRCYKKSKKSRLIKEQMIIRRMEYANNVGIDLNQLNDPRYSTTIHI